MSGASGRISITDGAFEEVELVEVQVLDEEMSQLGSGINGQLIKRTDITNSFCMDTRRSAFML